MTSQVSFDPAARRVAANEAEPPSLQPPAHSTIALSSAASSAG